MRRVLNVGGGSRAIALPEEYDGWEHVLLDIDPAVDPDIVCDARDLSPIPAASFDSVFCSHNLEHYHHHEVAAVLAGFRHVLADDGFAVICVPNLGAVMRMAVEQNLDIEDVVYQSAAGPITVRDVIFGANVISERSSNDYNLHRTGFTEKSLFSALTAAGFPWTFVSADSADIRALAFTRKPGLHAARFFQRPPNVD